MSKNFYLYVQNFLLKSAINQIQNLVFNFLISIYGSEVFYTIFKNSI